MAKTLAINLDDTITPQEYPPVLGIFEDGIYHLYDYQFFYRNIQSNDMVIWNSFHMYDLAFLTKMSYN